MPVNTQHFATGPATLPDVGTLFYNGCTFSPLFTTTLSGVAVKANDNRTIKYMEYALTVDGYVTMSAGLESIAPTMANLRVLLTAQAGVLTYEGRGFDLFVNAAGKAAFNGAARDVMWGPTPELIEFQPLGGGLSAKVKWTVKVCVSEYATIGKSGLLQFNCETTVSYGEDYYSSLSVRGTMEMPLTRPAQGVRTLNTTVDDRRGELDSRIFSGIDLDRFRVVRRNYSVSRDKRTMEFDVEVEEKPYMDTPPGCTLARGSMAVKPVAQGAGLCNWMCTLRASYTVRRDAPRRLAWWAFLAMLRLRMNEAELGFIPGLADNKNQNPPAPRPNDVREVIPPDTRASRVWGSILKQQAKFSKPNNAWLMDFSFDEGLYQDSKSVSFSASWRLVTTFDRILDASGLWRKLPENDNGGNNLWASTMKDVSKSVSWLPNKLDPTLDIIVDFGGG